MTPSDLQLLITFIIALLVIIGGLLLMLENRKK